MIRDSSFRTGVQRRTPGVKRYRIHGHEFRDTFKTTCKVAGVDGAVECPACDKRALAPKAYVPDLVASRAGHVVIEIYGAKSSIKDAAKMEFYRANGFTAVTVPNAVAGDAEYSKPIFQLLAVICGSDHPERLFAPELG